MTADERGMRIIVKKTAVAEQSGTNAEWQRNEHMICVCTDLPNIFRDYVCKSCIPGQFVELVRKVVRNKCGMVAE